MKFVRWLGAFGSGNSLHEAAEWETRQVDRQVAAEPLWHGRSFISHAKIGLSIAHPEATFARGWLADAYTEIADNGVIRATRNRDVEFKNMDKFLKKWNQGRLGDKGVPFGHAEASFNAPTYDAVVVKHDATERGKRRAKRLAEALNLPLRVL